MSNLVSIWLRSVLIHFYELIMMKSLNVKEKSLALLFWLFHIDYVKVVTTYSFSVWSKSLFKSFNFFRIYFVCLSNFLEGKACALEWGGFLDKNILNSLLDKLENGISFAHTRQYHCRVLSFNCSYSAKLIST